MTKKYNEKLLKIVQNIEKVIKGKTEVIRNALIAILAQGHILIEDVPGVGKTILAQLLAKSIHSSFQRIQFTSDLLPSDILGISVYDKNNSEFVFKKGPLFANIILGDEINRTTPKTQSALLEAMNAGQVTIDKFTYDLPKPFMVIATQNPIEFHGTFPLPKSQMDRFLMRINVGYPSISDEITILKEQKIPGDISFIEPVMEIEEFHEMQKKVLQVKIDDDLINYMAEIAAATRKNPQIELGISTRGVLALRSAAQAKAFFENRDFCVPDDIKILAPYVFAHRIQVIKTFENSSINNKEEEEILLKIINQVEVPV